MDVIAQHKRLVRRFVAAVNAQDWAALIRLVAADFRRHSQAAGHDIAGREALIDFLRAEAENFPGAHEEIEDIIGEGDKLAVRHRFHAVIAGQPVSVPYLAFYRMANGQIAEVWAEWDSAALPQHCPA